MRGTEFCFFDYSLCSLVFRQKDIKLPQLVEKLYLEKVEGTMPSIKEIEAKLDNQISI